LSFFFKLIYFKIIVNIPAQKFFGPVQRKHFGQVFDSTRMGSKRFENFELVQILFVWNFFSTSQHKSFLDRSKEGLRGPLRGI
jgi:hypothetical protein